MTNIIQNKKEYNQLKTDIQDIIATGREQLEKVAKEISVKTHWQVGRRLSQSIEQAESDRANEIINSLASDLGMHRSVLYRSFQFFRAYAEGLPSTPQFKSLSWGSHMELLPVSDEKERLFYINRSAEENWSRKELRAAVKAREHLAGSTKNKPADVKHLKRPVPGLYTYVAELERVVDGDTIIVRIDLGFDVLKRERIRLRGVDAPEIETDEGKKAEKFIRKKLRGIEKVILRTHWHDMYGRYVADVLYDSRDLSKDEVLKKGRFLNQELLDSGMARPA